MNDVLKKDEFLLLTDDKVKKLFEQVDEHLEAIAYHEEQIEIFKMEIKKVMEKYSIKEVDTDYFKATYIARTTRKTFDSKSFKEFDPVTYESFLKESEVKESVRLKLKD